MRSFKSLVVASILALAAIPTASQAGRIGAPVDQIDTVSAYSSLTYTLTFRGGDYAEIAISGDGDTDLDLYVYDNHGRLIASDTYPGDTGSVRFWVPNLASYQVVVMNRGGVYNDFAIASN